MTAPTGLSRFVRSHRVRITASGTVVRAVHWSEIASNGQAPSLHSYICDRLPLFYRDPEAVADRLREGLFLTAMKETLRRLPTADSFQQSHFGEIIAALFAEDVLQLRRLYSKLTFLSTQNSNAYKMDLVLCDLTKDPVEFVFAEVKSSMKSATDGGPPYHEGSCYASIFTSLNDYSEEDREFDLQAASDHLREFDDRERKRIRRALLPHSAPAVRYAAFAVIDAGTRDDSDMSVLATRKNAKTFEIDVIGVEALPAVVSDSWSYLTALRTTLNDTPKGA